MCQLKAACLMQWLLGSCIYQCAPKRLCRQGSAQQCQSRQWSLLLLSHQEQHLQQKYESGRGVLQETTASASHEIGTVAAISKTANAFANPIAALPASGKEDPFSNAAERSFDAPWCALIILISFFEIEAEFQNAGTQKGK